MKRCCICNAAIEHDDAPALVMSISGNPKLLCDDSVKVLDDITLGKDYDTIHRQSFFFNQMLLYFTLCLRKKNKRLVKVMSK